MKVKTAYIPIAGVLTVHYPETMSDAEVLEEAYNTQLEVKVSSKNPDIEVFVDEINVHEKIIDGNVINVDFYEVEFTEEG